MAQIEAAHPQDFRQRHPSSVHLLVETAEVWRHHDGSGFESLEHRLQSAVDPDVGIEIDHSVVPSLLQELREQEWLESCRVFDDIVLESHLLVIGDPQRRSLHHFVSQWPDRSRKVVGQDDAKRRFGVDLRNRIPQTQCLG